MYTYMLHRIQIEDWESICTAENNQMKNEPNDDLVARAR